MLLTQLDSFSVITVQYWLHFFGRKKETFAKLVRLSNGGLGTYSDRAIALHTSLPWSPLPASREHPDCGIRQLQNKCESHCDPHPPVFWPLHHPHFGSRHPHLHWLIFVCRIQADQ
ncbi:hypothetical protein CRYUN_Cryun07bG0020400 [Craigia yunnanensis]